MNNYTFYLRRFENYRWQLRALRAKENEFERISRDIDEGLITRDALDPNWQDSIQREISGLREQLLLTEGLIDLILETPEMFPCRLFLRLHYILGYSLTYTAEELNVSLTTLRRIRQRCRDFFDECPPI